MLTLEEFKKINKLSNEQLADLIGVSKEKVSMMLKGHEIIKDRKRIILRLKDLGVAPPDEECKIETTSRNLNKTITINEFF